MVVSSIRIREGIITVERSILAADIGGTNSRFAYFTFDGTLTLRDTIWLSTREADSFNGLVKTLRASEFPLKPYNADICSFAVAGAVERGGTYSNPPLIDWDIDVNSTEGLSRCELLNDFVAQAHACLSPIAGAAETVLEGVPVKGGTIAVLGAGTGLGKAALVKDEYGGYYYPMPSEGGHADYPFIGEREYVYRAFLAEATGSEDITPNTVVSGRGLSFLHQFLTGVILSPEDVSATLDTESETCRWFARFYGRLAKNFVLDTLATGGLYIAGGIAAKVPMLVKHPEFEREFTSSNTYAALLGNIPVKLISDQDSGLWGAAYHGKTVLERDNG
ncbi:glucokinase [Nitrospirota bacterium]